MTSDQLIKKLLLKYFDDITARPAINFRDDLIHLIRLAKAEQRTYDAEELVSHPGFQDAFFSIDSWR